MFVNQALVAMFGYAPEMLQLDPLALLREDYRAVGMQKIQLFDQLQEDLWWEAPCIASDGREGGL